MPDYCFFSKKARTSLRSRAQTPMRPLSSSLRGLKSSSRRSALRMKKKALTRLADIRKNNEIDRYNFLAGAGEMPLIGALAAAATWLVQKK